MNLQVVCTLLELNIFIKKTIYQATKIRYNKLQLYDELQVWKAVALGYMVHEIDTLSMVQNSKYGIVDTNLKFYYLQNVYTCDMSVISKCACESVTYTCYTSVASG